MYRRRQGRRAATPLGLDRRLLKWNEFLSHIPLESTASKCHYLVGRPPGAFAGRRRRTCDSPKLGPPLSPARRCSPVEALPRGTWRRRGRRRACRRGWWLMLVGSLRLASVWFGFFKMWALRVAVFSQTERMSIVWMLLQWNSHGDQSGCHAVKQS
ncbi:hypothetical protein SETIT_3G019400v2 [Setaria italica]|uniref:Uncharacterized protein n=1 Tax=Setaria italica TaxID=4555 RepID=A0A368QAB7_SETIT|nr:hypothetical protein SETIT_3G019400v2 [Setaria italica]